MDAHDPFLPTTLSQWLVSIGVIVGWTVIVWRALLIIKTDINNQGTKINALEIDNAKKTTEIESLKLDLQRSIDDRNTMRERIAGNARSLDELRDEIRDDRIAVLTTLHNNERSAAERDAVLREALARLQERINIEEIIKATLVRSLEVRPGRAS